ncbi:RDD family protein [Acetobacter conturbans]|uniref:RDD family protein n=1 Tax=Acetobacter conturbans TaxID=1737472 RepID=A0ABX0K256_9PROT|nr:RDD family protein [Acetobacter conturbans]NHN89340.1 RDD family protein [Acetobacter conturbans]
MSNSLPPGWGTPAEPSAPTDGRIPDGRVLAYAGFWIRAAAAILDFTLLSVTSVLVGLFTLPTIRLEQWQGDTPSYQVAFRSTDFMAGGTIPWPHIDVPDHGSYLLIFQLVYFIVLEASPLRATLGKLVLGLRVSDMQGNSISLVRSLVRTLVKIFISFPVAGIGVLMVAFTPRKQGLHDMVARTLVLRRERVVQFDNTP